MAVIQEFHIGQLREVIKFERNTAVSDDAGGEDEFGPVWVEFLTTRGKLRKKSGGRGLEASEIVLNSSYEIIVRYQQELADGLASPDTLRLVCNNRFFTVTSYELQDERIRYYIFKCNEKGR